MNETYLQIYLTEIEYALVYLNKFCNLEKSEMTYQKKLIKSLVASTFLVAATTASAVEFNPSPYVGIGGSYNMSQKGTLQNDLNASLDTWKAAVNNSSISKMQENRPAMNFIVGVNLIDYLGLEFSYNYVFDAKATATNGDQNAKLKFKQYSFNFDAVGKVPVDENFSLIGTVGAGYLKQSFTTEISSNFGDTDADRALKTALNAYNDKSKGSVVPRLGIGIGYTVENVSVRLMGRYIPVTTKMTIGNKNDKFIKGNVSVGADVLYSFN